MKLQQYTDHLSPDMTIDTSACKEKNVEKETFPNQLYRHIKVCNGTWKMILFSSRALKWPNLF